MTSPIEKPTYLLRTLGLVGLEARGERVTGPASQRRRLALLALVGASIGQRLSREKVLAYLWPETDAERGRNALSQLLHGIKRELGDGLIATPDEISLNERVISVDVADFRSAVARLDWERAVSIYAGPFLDGFFIKDAPEFEQWADETRRNLQQECVVALERVAAAARSRGDHQAALRAWRQLSRVEPYSGRAVLGAMESLAALGDPAAALEEARIHGLLLKNELEAAPDADVERFADRLRRGELAAAVTNTTLKPGPVDSNAPPVGEPALESGMPPALDNKDVARLPRRSRRILMFVAGAAIAALSGIVATAWSRVAHSGTSKRIVVRIDDFATTGDSTKGLLGALAKDEVANAVEQLANTLVLRSPAPGTGAPNVVVDGTIVAERDSANVVVRIHGDSGTRVSETIIKTVPVDAHLGLALSQLAARVEGALAPVLDVTLANDVPRHTLSAPPPTYQAYATLQTGRRRYSLGDIRGAVNSFTAAYGADSDFIAAALYRAKGLFELGEFDSLQATVATMRLHAKAPVDLASIDVDSLWYEGDWPNYEAAALHLLDLSPGSELARIAAVRGAYQSRRPHLADSLIRAGPIPVRWGTSMNLQYGPHMLGEFDRAIAILEQARALRPTTAIVLTEEARNYAAMRRPTDVERCLAEIVPTDEVVYFSRGEAARQAASEFQAHGDADDARRFRAEALSWYRQQRAERLQDHDYRMLFTQALLDADSLSAARSQLDTLATLKMGQLDSIATIGGLGIIAAKQRDAAAAQVADVWLAQHPLRYTRGAPFIWRARIAIALGDTARAADDLVKGLERGYPVYDSPNIYDPLHQISGVQALLRIPRVHALVRNLD